VTKADPRVDAYGEIDELNAVLGSARALVADEALGDQLEAIQRDLFALGARLADPVGHIASRVRKVVIGPDEVARLEGWIDQHEADLPPLRHFILPGGSPAGAALHHARTVCRRAERRIVSLGAGAVEPDVLAYVNRLSDLLFVLARAANQHAGAAELKW